MDHTSASTNGAQEGTNVMVEKLFARLRMLRRNDSGQDLLEYALLVALIALVAIGAITTTGQGVSGVFTEISTQLAP
jgi:pilus assembly protein Flp/PilA